jgi:hypothetical protein
MRKEKRLLYTKNMYILKLLLNVDTTGIEALVLSGKFLYACELSHILTPSINSLLLRSKPVLQVGNRWQSLRARTVL